MGYAAQTAHRASESGDAGRGGCEQVTGGDAWMTSAYGRLVSGAMTQGTASAGEGTDGGHGWARPLERGCDEQTETGGAGQRHGTPTDGEQVTSDAGEHACAGAMATVACAPVMTAARATEILSAGASMLECLTTR
jgi:hypothetical protein